MTQAPWLNDIAVALADGRPIDWAAVDARAVTEEERAMASRFRLIERVLQAHVLPDGTLSVELPGAAAVSVQTAEDVDDEVGRTWGPLTILQRIGRGTYGDVYRAHDPRLDRVVALKLLRRREAGGDARESAVIEEARLLARVHHPNVVTVHGAERIDGRVGLWMEFLEGHTLAEEVRLGGPRSAGAIARIGRELCGALTAVHDAGLLHHDLKAQNVMRTQDGRIVLADFGAGQDSRGSGPGAGSPPLIGTPAYLAPEVLGGQPATIQSEVYSLGVLLYHLATGTFPVRGRSLQAFRDAHAHAIGANVELLAARSDMPPALVAAITRCLAPAPGARFQAMDELAAALGTALEASPRHTAVTSNHLPRPSRFTWRAAGIVAASMALSAGAGFVGSYASPEIYESTALIQMVPQQVPEVYVNAAGVPALGDRIGAIRTRITTRRRLEALIKELDLYREIRATGVMEDAVERMRGEVTLAPRGETLEVSYVGRDPRVVQKVADRVSDLAINESFRDRENLTAGTDQFLESTLEDIRRRLAEHETKLKTIGAGGAAAVEVRRDYEELQTQYRNWFQKREAAKTGANLERRSLGSQFRLLEAARLPQRPISPNRVSFAGLGALAGLVLGLLVVGLWQRPRR